MPRWNGFAIFRVTRFIGAEDLRDVCEGFGAAARSFPFKESILLKRRARCVERNLSQSSHVSLPRRSGVRL